MKTSFEMGMQIRYRNISMETLRLLSLSTIRTVKVDRCEFSGEKLIPKTDHEYAIK